MLERTSSGVSGRTGRGYEAIWSYTERRTRAVTQRNTTHHAPIRLFFPDRLPLASYRILAFQPQPRLGDHRGLRGIPLRLGPILWCFRRSHHGDALPQGVHTHLPRSHPVDHRDPSPPSLSPHSQGRVPPHSLASSSIDGSRRA